MPLQRPAYSKPQWSDDVVPPSAVRSAERGLECRAHKPGGGPAQKDSVNQGLISMHIRCLDYEDLKEDEAAQEYQG